MSRTTSEQVLTGITRRIMDAAHPARPHNVSAARRPRMVMIGGTGFPRRAFM